MPTTIDTTPDDVDLVLYADDDTLYELEFVDDDDEPVSIAGYAFTAQLRSDQGVLLGAFTIVVVDAAIGRLDLSLPAATALLLAGKYGRWDLQAVGAAGRQTWMAGKFRVDADVTRAG